jgi:lipopolysaccharide export system protein LptA
VARERERRRPRRTAVGRLLPGLWLAAAALCAPSPSAAQQRVRLVIERADQIQRLAQGDSVSYYLDGNVRARRGDLHLTAQHVVLLDWLGIADFSRDVHLWDAEKELYADHATYTDSSDVAVATGDVQLIDRESGSQLKSQQVVYDRPAGVLTATQKPEILLLPEVEGGAEPDSAPEPIHIWGEQVQLFDGTDEVWATGDALLRRGEALTAKADSLRYAGAEERLDLRGRPRVETERFYIEAREIDILLPDDRIQELVARGGAKASSSADSIPAAALEALGSPSPSSWLSGDTLRFAFDQEVLRSVRASGDARSLNYALESRAGDAATWALSYLLAGRIVLHFDAAGEGVERVEASEAGRGVYRTVAVTAGEPEATPTTGEVEGGPAPGDATGAALAAEDPAAGQGHLGPLAGEEVPGEGVPGGAADSAGGTP